MFFNDVISVIFLFGIIIIFHEFGHFIFAKLSGIEVYEFSFGFGPELFKYETLETVYKICLFPIGGYVKLAGMEENDAELENGFRKKPILSKISVILTGSGMNIFLAVLVLFSLRFIWGKPNIVTFIQDVKSNSPAYKAGLMKNDYIYEVNGKIVENSKDFVESIKRSNGNKVVLKIQRDGKIIFKEVIPEFDLKLGRWLIGVEINNKVLLSNTIAYIKSGFVSNLRVGDKIVEINGNIIREGEYFEGVLNRFLNAEARVYKIKFKRGEKFFYSTVSLQELYKNLSFKPLYKKMGFGKAIISGFDETGKTLKLFCVGLYYMIMGKISRNDVAGPIGIIKLSTTVSKAGFDQLLHFIAFLSINLAIINMIPFPALDGSRFVLILWEGIIKRPINPKKENVFHYVGFVILILLLIFLTYKDIYFPSHFLK